MKKAANKTDDLVETADEKRDRAANKNFNHVKDAVLYLLGALLALGLLALFDTGSLRGLLLGLLLFACGLGCGLLFKTRITLR